MMGNVIGCISIKILVRITIISGSSGSSTRFLLRWMSAAAATAHYTWDNLELELAAGLQAVATSAAAGGRRPIAQGAAADAQG